MLTYQSYLGNTNSDYGILVQTTLVTMVILREVSKYKHTSALGSAV